MRRISSSSSRQTRETQQGRRKPSKKSGVRRLLPVLRPCQNMRDIIKQMVMLEDHLFHPQKRCKDCIRKHFLTIEALAEECTTLCKPAAILPESRKIATTVRILHHAWEQRPKDPVVAETIGGKLRKARKALMARFSALPVHKLPTRETNEVNKLLGHFGHFSQKRSTQKRRGVRRGRRGVRR